jgi:hypothetical protein
MRAHQIIVKECKENLTARTTYTHDGPRRRKPERGVPAVAGVPRGPRDDHCSDLPALPAALCRTRRLGRVELTHRMHMRAGASTLRTCPESP